jgi:hypothetical protein
MVIKPKNIEEFQNWLSAGLKKFSNGPVQVVTGKHEESIRSAFKDWGKFPPSKE